MAKSILLFNRCPQIPSPRTIRPASADTAGGASSVRRARDRRSAQGPSRGRCSECCSLLQYSRLARDELPG